jgi:phosphatidate cytidylyltransferase
MTELGTRIVSAVVMGAVALAVTYQGGWVSAAFWLAAGIAVLAEWIALTGVEPRRPAQIMLAGGLMCLAFVHLLGAKPGTAVLLLGAVLGSAVVVHRDPDHQIWAATGFLYASVIALIPTFVRDTPEFGLVGLLWMFAIVWTTDVAAYFTGRSLGGPKLWPRVSPKKTWSGFIGGVLAGSLAGILVVAVAQRFGWVSPFGLGPVALGSVVAAAASQAGDLGESALKRQFGVKDSGYLIPGHGGVMDRLDGFWAVALLAGIVLLGWRGLPA